MIPRYQTREIAEIWSPEARTRAWLEVEIAVARASALFGYIPQESAEEIARRASFDLKRMEELEQETRHDLMAFVRNVEETVGEHGRYVHYGVTSYDIIDTALALLLRQSLDQLLRSLQSLQKAIREVAQEHADTPMVGRTHGVHAEPITFGFKLAGWHAELERAGERLRQCREEISVGKIAGAVGVYGVLDPRVEEEVCRLLELKPDPAPTQIVARDRLAHLMGVLATLAGTLEKIATELRNLQRTEILEVQEEFGSGQTGSSAMPHKRNPWMSETVCGLARVVRGNAMAVLETVSTWHERDLTNSSVERIVLPDTFHLLDFMLQRLTHIVKNLKVFPARMKENLKRTKGLVFSEHVLMALVQKGLSREEAYRLVQRNSAKAWEGEDFQQCLLSDQEVLSHLSEEEIKRCFDLSHHLRNVPYVLRRTGIGKGI
ncbi:MAG: adenylosuccinate lyase [Fimbriimonadales bacterium]|nr:adenylosuccinate lyase [Fimbriimonadales bacterium]